MSAGEAVEFDGPLALLQDKRSMFSAMVGKTGRETSDRLHQIAIDADRKRNQNTLFNIMTVQS